MSHPGLNVAAIRADFPILQQQVHGKPLVYLDSAATSQKPQVVIRAMETYYRQTNANVHRGVYTLSEQATEQYEGARRKIQKFINAKSFREIIYTRNATEALNLVAYTWGRANIHAGDEIVSTVLEHHANIVPWQILAKDQDARLKFIRVDEEGLLRTDDLDTLITPKTKLVAATMASNVAGTLTPIRSIIERAHAVGAVCVVDAAQAAPHLPLDVQALDCDFLAFSGHKMLGPFIGILYGKRARLEGMKPFLTGGDMIREVHLDAATWNELPWKFEAGTPAIAEAIGLGAAVDYLSALGMQNVQAYEHTLTAYALEQFRALKGVRVLGPQDPAQRGGLVAFDIAGAHPHDVAQIFDQEGVCVRAGHHCAMPLHEQYGLAATTRASFYIYNTLEEVDKLVETIKKVQRVFNAP